MKLASLLALVAVVSAPSAALAGEVTKPSSPSGPAPAQPILVVPPITPARLDFPGAHDAETRVMTARLTSPGAGELLATLSDASFRIQEIRIASRSPIAGGGPLRTVKRSTAPFQIKVDAGSEIEIDVAFLPVPGVPVSRGATLTITGPGPVVGWTQKVALTGKYIPGVQLQTIARVNAVEPQTEVELPFNVVGTDHDVKGHFLIKDGPTNVFLEGGPDILIKKDIVQPVKTRLKLNNFWFGGGANRPGGYVHVVFVYEGHFSPEAYTDLHVYPRWRQIETKDVSHSSCDPEKVSGFVTVKGEGQIDLQFSWNASSWSPDDSVAELFRVFYAGKLLAEGIYPKTQNSTVYFKGVNPSVFRTTYDPAQFVTMFDDPAFSFTCKEVPAKTRF